MIHEDKSQCYGYDGDERYTRHWFGIHYELEGNDLMKYRSQVAARIILLLNCIQATYIQQKQARTPRI